VRFVASVVAGGALAAAGQHALVAALPAATGGANVLRLGVEELLGSSSETPADVTVAPRPAIGPVVPAGAPVVADAAGLVKAAGLQQAAAAAVTAPATAGFAPAAQAVVAAPAATAAAAAPDAATRATTAPRTSAQATAAPRTSAPATKAPATTAPATKAPASKAPRTAAPVAAAAAGGVQVVVGTVTSGFGGRWGTVHQGLDIAAPIGTPIHAPLAGKVISSGPSSGFGLWVRLQHADGTITVYGHINRSLVSVGQQVQAGQVIAEVGNRGQSTGPHLHIGVMINGTYVDPRPWLDQRGIRY
jgi:murein DD-endopeptidase MepM/ murein hydrolase activator NlpD